MFSNIENSISLQLLKRIFIIYFSITIVMTLAQIVIEYYATKDRIKEELLHLEEIFKEPLKNAIWDLNTDQIQNIALAMSKLSIIKEVTIKDAQESLLSHFKDATNGYPFYHSFTIMQHYADQTLLIGKVTIASDTDAVIDVLKLGIYLILINAALKSLILVFLFIWVFKKYLIKPLEAFTETITTIDLNTLATQRVVIDTNNDTELAVVQNKFNTMLETINDQKNKLLAIKQDYLDQLEAEVKERTIALQESNQELKRMATTDYLTNIKNRRSFYDNSEQYFNIAKRKKLYLSVLAFDIDHFKDLNDTYGHQAGDEALVVFTQVCEQELRDSDVFGRTGGEEFAATLLDASLDQAVGLAERMIKQVSQIRVMHEGEEIRFTVSIGVTQMRDDDVSIDTIMSRADHALYKAKEGGRNRVETTMENVTL